MSGSCGCQCHGQSSTFGSCSIEGGCGHLHADDRDLHCARQQRCADARTRTVHDDKGNPQRTRTPAWAVIEGGLCRMCMQVTQRAIEQLPADYVELSALLGKTSTTGEVSTGGTRELPVPIRLGVEALQAAILDETERWAVLVAEAAGSEYEQRGTRAERVRAAVGVLGQWFDRFLSLPPSDQQRFDPTDELMSGKDATVFTVESGVDGALLLLEMHEQVRVLAGRTTRARRLYTPCPKCQRLTLEHPDGASFVECRRCTHRMTLDQYDELASVLARAYGDEGAA